MIYSSIIILFKSFGLGTNISQRFHLSAGTASTTFTLFLHKILNSLSQLANIIFLSFMNNLKIVSFFFKKSNPFSELFSFILKFFSIQMINVEWLTAFGEGFSFLFSLS